MIARALLLVATGFFGCVETAPTLIPVCEEGVRTEAASPPDRRLLGAPEAYQADSMLVSRMEELLTSQRARRAAAWEVVERVLSPVALTEATPVDGATVPRFRTWYDRDDVTRAFEHAYENLGPEGRALRAHFTEASLDEAFDWNLHALENLSAWGEARFQAYVASLVDETTVASVGGLRRIAMSPDAARHVAASYPEIFNCLQNGFPSAFVDGPPEGMQRLVREPVMLNRCTSRVVGPYYVASDATITAWLEGSGAGAATVRLLSGATAALGEERCAAAATSPGCEADGPGVFFVEVIAGSVATDAMLEVGFTAPSIEVAGCLRGVFPLRSATVAAEWRRVELGPLPTYDTSAESLAARLAPNATSSWGPGDGEAEPGPGEIYTLRLSGGGNFRLAGLHIRTRELEHWMNITLWWSPTPDETFGADRPSSVAALGGPWSHYAMCVAIDDREGDSDPTGGFAETEPSLAEALTAVHEGPGGPSWCSNPYIDAAPGLVRTNCVGCHQHAMTGVRPGDVVMDEARYPASGRLFVRNNVPADQFWGLDAGDDLATMISETVLYWDTTP